MIKIEEYNEIKVLAGGGVKPFMYQVPNVRFHISLSGKVSDYKIGCAEILRLFIGRNLYHAHSVHMNKQREDKVNYEEPSLGEFLRTYKIGSGDIDNLLPSCPRCNKWKSTYSLEKFREVIKTSIDRLHRDTPSYRLAKDFGLISENNTNIVFFYETLK